MKNVKKEYKPDVEQNSIHFNFLSGNLTTEEYINECIPYFLISLSPKRDK